MEIEALKGYYELSLMGESSKLDYEFNKIESNIKRKYDFHFGYPLIARKFISSVLKAYFSVEQAFKFVLRKSSNQVNVKKVILLKPEIVIQHGISNIEWVSKAIDILGAKLVINIHEYYPLEHADDEAWRRNIEPVYRERIRKYFKGNFYYFTVCQTILDKFENEFGLKHQLLIRNTKPFHKLSPVESRSSTIKLIHHGASIRSRKLELLIEAMKFLPENYLLDLMLVPGSEYYDELRLGNKDRRIKFVEPVETNMIIERINNYDIGVYLLPPVNFNHQFALPNKIFEFIQARLAIVVSPNPEMKRIVEEFGLGAVSKDYSPQEFASAILSLSKDEIQKCKTNTNHAAEQLNDKEEQRKILNCIDGL